MTIHNVGSSAGFNIALKREGGKRIKKKRKRNYHNTGYSYLVTHPSTNPAEQGLTLLSGRDMVLTLRWTPLFLTRKGDKEREKKTIDTGTQKNEWNKNENYYLLWWSNKKRYFLHGKYLKKWNCSISQRDKCLIVYWPLPITNFLRLLDLSVISA